MFFRQKELNSQALGRILRHTAQSLGLQIRGDGFCQLQDVVKLSRGRHLGQDAPTPGKGLVRLKQYLYDDCLYVHMDTPTFCRVSAPPGRTFWRWMNSPPWLRQWKTSRQVPPVRRWGSSHLQFYFFFLRGDIHVHL